MRRTVKHQHVIVDADFAAIATRRNQTEIDRTKAHQAAIARAKAKKDKESKKDKTKPVIGESEPDTDWDALSKHSGGSEKPPFCWGGRDRCCCSETPWNRSWQTGVPAF
ncbi:hypothetical protein DFH11DRAFT_1726395 [Phellopilus nigrolimitatus]|nr:hypothetical protein DFH11DRAFT_1726395 [Phellopilus nigrolimitatus]